MFIVVLGGGIDLKGTLPPHVFQRLDKAIDIYRRNQKTDKSDNRIIGHLSSDLSSPSSETSDIRIILSGKYSFLYSKEKPAFTEARKMAEYLISQGVPKTKLLLETKSKDSIGNAYYLKKNVFRPRHEKQAVIITSQFHLQRIKFIFQQIFGQNYKFQFIGVKENIPQEEENKICARQRELLLKTKDLLSKMKIGDHNFLKGRIYKFKYYREKRPKWVTNFTAKGKT